MAELVVVAAAEVDEHHMHHHQGHVDGRIEIEMPCNCRIAELVGEN